MVNLVPQGGGNAEGGGHGGGGEWSTSANQTLTYFNSEDGRSTRSRTRSGTWMDDDDYDEGKVERKERWKRWMDGRRDRTESHEKGRRGEVRRVSAGLKHPSIASVDRQNTTNEKAEQRVEKAAKDVQV